jgi:hypothetical protein
MATYEQVQQDLKERHGISVKSCWIAHVKEMNGLPMRRAPNRRSMDMRVHPCPEKWRPAIEDSMRRLGMLGRQDSRPVQTPSARR